MGCSPVWLLVCCLLVCCLLVCWLLVCCLLSIASWSVAYWSVASCLLPPGLLPPGHVLCSEAGCPPYLIRPRIRPGSSVSHMHAYCGVITPTGSAQQPVGEVKGRAVLVSMAISSLRTERVGTTETFVLSVLSCPHATWTHVLLAQMVAAPSGRPPPSRRSQTMDLSQRDRSPPLWVRDAVLTPEAVTAFTGKPKKSRWFFIGSIR